MLLTCMYTIYVNAVLCELIIIWSTCRNYPGFKKGPLTPYPRKQATRIAALAYIYDIDIFTTKMLTKVQICRLVF